MFRRPMSASHALADAMNGSSYEVAAGGLVTVSRSRGAVLSSASPPASWFLIAVELEGPWPEEEVGSSRGSLRVVELLFALFHHGCRPRALPDQRDVHSKLSTSRCAPPARRSVRVLQAGIPSSSARRAPVERGDSWAARSMFETSLSRVSF